MSDYNCSVFRESGYLDTLIKIHSEKFVNNFHKHNEHMLSIRLPGLMSLIFNNTLIISLTLR